MRGDWRTALKIAAWPTLMPFVLACVLGIFSSHDTDGAGLGWGVRMRCALAVLLQSVGGRITLSGSATGPLGRFGEGLTGEMSLSLVPLVITGCGCCCWRSPPAGPVVRPPWEPWAGGRDPFRPRYRVRPSRGRP